MPNNSMTNYNNYHLILFSSSADSAFDHKCGENESVHPICYN